MIEKEEFSPDSIRPLLKRAMEIALKKEGDKGGDKGEVLKNLRSDFRAATKETWWEASGYLQRLAEMGALKVGGRGDIGMEVVGMLLGGNFKAALVLHRFLGLTGHVNLKDKVLEEMVASSAAKMKKAMASAEVVADGDGDLDAVLEVAEKRLAVANQFSEIRWAIGFLERKLSRDAENNAVFTALKELDDATTAGAVVPAAGDVTEEPPAPVVIPAEPPDPKAELEAKIAELEAQQAEAIKSKAFGQAGKLEGQLTQLREELVRITAPVEAPTPVDDPKAEFITEVEGVFAGEESAKTRASLVNLANKNLEAAKIMFVDLTEKK